MGQKVDIGNGNFRECTLGDKKSRDINKCELWKKSEGLER